MDRPCLAAGFTALMLAVGPASAIADGSARDSAYPSEQDAPAPVIPSLPQAPSAGPTYPGPSVDTWLGRRFPPPAPPPDFGFGAAQGGDPGLGVAEMLIVVGGSTPQDRSELDACMEAATADGMDYIDGLGACFCLVVGSAELAPGCAPAD